jgi:quercetin dioxygenase-like cupin family protein
MKVVTLRDIPNIPVEGAAEPIEGWAGPVARSRQTIVEPGESTDYNCSVVNFSQSCTTGWHTHTCDQLLIVTSGVGMVATEHEQQEINGGDVVHIKADERHWHGAKADTAMGHITITLVGGQATWDNCGSARTLPGAWFKRGSHWPVNDGDPAQRATARCGLALSAPGRWARRSRAA